MYDIIYIGGGLNYAGAVVAAKSGKKVALIQKDLKEFGGTCLHRGCIPSKLFLHYGALVYESSDEVLEGKLTLSQKKLYEKKSKLLENANKAILKQCSHFDTIEGEAKLIAPHKVSVNGDVLEAEYIVIGTGSSAFIPDGIDYDGEGVIISDDVLNMQTLPREVAIYGTGAIGLEMASFFASVGVKVTLIDRGENLLAHADEAISSAMHKQLEKMGIELLQNRAIKSAKSTQEGVAVLYEDGSSTVFEKLLVATGRRPNTEVIATKEIEVAKGIVTDAHFETSLAKHYAIGDCNGKLQLAHAARAEVLQVTAEILGNKVKPLNLEHVVKFIHTLLMSYAFVGKIRSELESKGIKYRASKVPLSQFAYASYNHALSGIMITYVDEEEFILGAEIFAPHAEELIAPVAMSLAGEMDVAHAKETILAHPSFSEALERTFYKL